MDAIGLLKSHEQKIRQDFGVRAIGIFGSFARGEARKGSDVDVLVDFEEGKKTFDHFMDLKFFLEDLFGRKVDLVTMAALRPQLKEEIIKEVTYA